MIRLLQDQLEWFLGRNVIIPCYAFDLPNGGDCFLKTDRDFDGWTTTTYCEVCEISDGNKGVLGWKKCDDSPTNCTLIPQPLTDEHDHPAWVFTSYDDNSLCDCGAPFIYHSRAFLPYSRTSRNDFLESRNLNDYFARPLEPEEKECFASHRGYKHQPILYENSASPYPDPDSRIQATTWYGRIKATRWFTGWSERLSSPPLPSISASQCRSRPDISHIFERIPPLYPEKCDADWFQVGSVCFKQFTSSLVSWLEAALICRENDAELASIPDEETQNRVWKEVKYLPSGLLWIGGEKNPNDEWVWTDIGSKIGDGYWDWEDWGGLRWNSSWSWDNWSSRPQGSGRCLAMQRNTGGKWIAVDCDTPLTFVCSRDVQRRSWS